MAVSRTTRQFVQFVLASVAAALIVDWIRRRRTKASMSVINGGGTAQQ